MKAIIVVASAAFVVMVPIYVNVVFKGFSTKLFDHYQIGLTVNSKVITEVTCLFFIFDPRQNDSFRNKGMQLTQMGIHCIKATF